MVESRIRLEEHLGDGEPPCAVQVGVYPPPVGGISIHVQRLAAYVAQQGWRSTVFSVNPRHQEAGQTVKVIALRKSVSAIVQYCVHCRPQRASLVHFHVSRFGRFIRGGQPLFWAARTRPRIVTIHGGRLTAEFDRMRWAERAMITRVLHQSEHVITVTDELREFLTARLSIQKERVSTIPAYIPPVIRAEESEVLSGAVLNLRMRVQRMVLMAGAMEPVSGFHIALSAVQQQLGSRLGFVIATYGEWHADYAERVLALCKGSEYVLLLRDLSPDEYLTVLSQCDAYLRPTLMDGDSVSIREALMLGTPVVATDVVRRPDGCSLFSVKHTEELLKLLEELPVSSERTKRRVKVQEHYGASVFALYRQLISAR